MEHELVARAAGEKSRQSLVQWQRGHGLGEQRLAFLGWIKMISSADLLK